MIKIYRPTDKIPVKVGPITFLLSPMTLSQKGEVNAMAKIESGEVKGDAISITKAYLRFCLKGIEGADIQYADGTAFALKFEENGYLSDQSIEEVACLDQIIPVMQVITSWVVNNKVFDPKIAGVEIKIKDESPSKKKKTTQE